MVFWRQKIKQTAGFTLIEVLVAITILGLVVVPISSSLLVSFRLNARSETTMQAQLAVSRAVETIMAEGIDKNKIIDAADGRFYEDDRLTSVVVEITAGPGEEIEKAAYAITVTALDPDSVDDTSMNPRENATVLDRISVDTHVRPAIEEGGSTDD